MAAMEESRRQMKRIEVTQLEKAKEAFLSNPTAEAFYGLPLLIGLGEGYGRWWWD